MATAIGSILRAATRTPDAPLNILTFPTHERIESGICRTGHNFYAYRAEGIKDWNTKYAPLPGNYVLLNQDKKERQIPQHVDFDLVLSQNKFGQFQVAVQLARQLHLPLVSLEHTLPPPGTMKPTLDKLKSMRGHINLFISEFSREKWGWGPNEADVIHHGVDTEVFQFGDNQREPRLLSVVNDWVNRDWCCGFRLWKTVSQGLPVKVVGATPGLSKPAGSIEELVGEYQQSHVFLNTSLISPVPTALLEAMACGCAIVSTATCMIPEIILNGVNGFISNDQKQLTEYCQLLLKDTDLCRRLGEAARQTIEDRFSMKSFVEKWGAALRSASNVVYRGE